MGDAVTKDDARLPTVLENEDIAEPMKKNKFLTPPHLSPPELHKVSSATSIKLMGVPVTDNDPLGALSTSPPQATSSSTAHTLQKSATASELLHAKRPSLQDNILGAPFSTTMEMSRSSTMPLSGK